MSETSFSIGRETIVSSARPTLSVWRDHLFIALSHTALDATEFFCIPLNRVIEVGSQIEV